MSPADDHGGAPPESILIDEDRPHDTPAYRAMLAEVAATDPDLDDVLSLEQVQAWVASWGTDNEQPMPSPKPRNR